MPPRPSDRSPRYRQCVLRRDEPPAVVELTTWLPECFAAEGQILRLRRDDGSWEGGWRVDRAGREAVDEAYLRRAERAHLRQRRASDI